MNYIHWRDSIHGLELLDMNEEVLYTSKPTYNPLGIYLVSCLTIIFSGLISLADIRNKLVKKKNKVCFFVEADYSNMIQTFFFFDYDYKLPYLAKVHTYAHFKK